MSDEVGFRKPQKLDAVHEAAYKVLTAALEATGDGVLTEWEEKFTSSCIKDLETQRNRWDLTTNRNQVIDAIERKLTKAGLL